MITGDVCILDVEIKVGVNIKLQMHLYDLKTHANLYPKTMGTI